MLPDEMSETESLSLSLMASFPPVFVAAGAAVIA